MIQTGVRAFAPLILMSWVVAAVTAQKAPDPQRPVFRSVIDLVQVDVVAVDEAGKPVRGLTAADFTVYDRKKAQTIATFEEVSHARSPEVAGTARAPSADVKRDVASNQTAQSQRLVVMVIDDLHIFKGRTDRTKDIARSVVRDLGGEASMAVLFTSGEHSIEVTEDRSELLAAIDEVKGRRPYPRPILANDRLRGRSPDPTTDIKEFYDDMSAYKTLQDAARLIGRGDARRKAFVFVSEGIGKDLSGILGAMSPPGDIPEGGDVYAATGDASATIAPSPEQFHATAVVDMMEAMRRANVATYAIDPRGFVSSQDLMRECHPAIGFLDDPCLGGNLLPDWNSWVRQAQHGLEMTAAASGGFAITNTDDFTSGIERIIDDLDHYYLLGFYPADPSGKGYRLLDVKVNRPGVTLRFRRGYEAGPPPAPPKNADPLVALSSGVMPRTDLPMRLAAMPRPGPVPLTGPAAARAARPPGGRGPVLRDVAGTSRVTIALEVSLSRGDVASAAGAARDTVHYALLAVNLKNGKVAANVSNFVRLTSEALGSEPPGGSVPFQIPFDLALPAGRYQLRASATSETLGLGGSVYLAIEVPDFSAQPLSLGAVAIGMAGGGHEAVAAGSSAAGAWPFTPVLDRTFANSDTLRLYAEADARDRKAALTARVEVLDAAGQVAWAATPALEGHAPAHLDLAIPVAGLGSGAYVMRVTLSDLTRAVHRDVGFAIR
jgi:VWFA-related protein